MPQGLLADGKQPEDEENTAQEAAQEGETLEEEQAEEMGEEQEAPPPGGELEPASEEEEAMLQEISSEVIAGVTEQQHFDKFLARLSKGARDPVDLIAEEAATAVAMFDGAVGDSIPEELVIHVVLEVAGKLADIVQSSGAVEQGDEFDKAVATAAVRAAFEAYGQEIPPEYAQQGGEQAPQGAPMPAQGAPQAGPPAQQPPMQGGMA